MRTAIAAFLSRRGAREQVCVADEETPLLLTDPSHFAHTFNGILLGIDQPAAVPVDAANRLEFALLDRVQRLVSEGISVADLPRLPSIVPLLLERMRNSESLDQLTALVERDPTLAAQVMHLANSPAFLGVRATAGNVREALLYVGENGLRALLMATIMRGSFRVRNSLFRLFGRSLWQHSLDCARACRALATDAGEDTSRAFFLGLVHDLGKLAVLQLTLSAVEGDQFRHTVRPLLLRDVITRYGDQLTLSACDGWAIPSDLKGALRQHVLGDPRTMSPLARVLHAAEVLAEGHLVLARRLAPRHEVMAQLKDRGVAWSSLIQVFPEDRHPRADLVGL